MFKKFTFGLCIAAFGVFWSVDQSIHAPSQQALADVGNTSGYVEVYVRR